MPKRSIPILTAIILVAAAMFSLHRVYTFGQERFFSIDEYQFGHATWLIGQGEVPYVDFFEHHFPLSYVLHGVFYAGDPGSATFGELALRLRKIVFAYIIAACLLAGFATFATRRDPYEALLAGFLPVMFGFGLMSAVDYRADSIAAFAFLSCLFLLELNRSLRLRSLALVAGVVAMLAAFMTQKIAAVGGVTIAAMLAVDLIRRLISRRNSRAEPHYFIWWPLAFGASASVILIFVLGGAAALGILGDAFEITILQALEHEQVYRARSIAPYLEPFLAATAYSTIPIVLFAGIYLLAPGAGFWRWVVLIAIAGGAMLRAKYPYNYIYLSCLVAFCSVRGYALVVRSLPLKGALSKARPLAYLLPLLVLPDQIDFVSHTSSNALQLELLNKIQQYSSESDEVIDNAGGGLFRNHASYWFHHGEFHRELYRKQFRTKLLREYRASRARFWIKDFRSKRLPARAREYLERHYVRMDGDLHVLGFRIPAYSPERSVFEIDVVSEAEYFLFPADVRQGRGDRARATGIWLDGSQVRSNSVRLTEGLHSVQLEPGSRDSLLSILPPEAFSSRAHELDWTRLHHSRLFEYSSAN